MNKKNTVPKQNKKIPLTVVSNSASKGSSLLHMTTKDIPYFRGEGKIDYTCGNCGFVLMSSMPSNKNIINVLCVCSNCGKVNDLGKVDKYYANPELRSYLNSNNCGTIRPTSEISLVEERYRKIFIDLQADLESEWLGIEQKDCPEVIYHYTSPMGVMNIIDKSKLWATHMGYLNDTTEYKLAENLIKEISDPIKEGLNDNGRLLLEKSLPVDSDAHGNRPYVTCFCTEGDLLSQWRAYGDNGSGYAIGFKTNAIGLFDNKSVSILRKVVYNPDRQKFIVENVIKKTCDLFNKTIEGKGEVEIKNLLSVFSNFLGRHLNEFLYCFKHKAFSEENEWRVINFRNTIDNSLDSIKLRSSANFIIPYTETDLNSTNESYPLLSIREIIVGPSVNDKLSAYSLHILLKQKDYDHVEVVPSQAPYRV